MNDTFINPYRIKKSIIPDDIDLYEEYRKIQKKQSNYSSAIRKAIVEEVEKRLNNNIKN